MADPSVKGVYNVGFDGQNYTKRELAGFVAERTGASLRITHSEDNRDYRVSFAKIRDAIGFEAKHTPRTEVPRLIDEWKRTHGNETGSDVEVPQGADGAAAS